MQTIQTMKAIIDQNVSWMKEVMFILNSDLSRTCSDALPETSSTTQVAPFYSLLLASLMSEIRSSAAQICFMVFCFLFQLSMYHVDQIASMMMYG